MADSGGSRRAPRSAAARRRALKALVGRIGIAVVVLAVLVGAFQANRSRPIRQFNPLPATGVIGPGIGIDVSYADGSGRISCTTGFLVHTGDGQPGLLVAGHCNRPGGPGRVTIHYRGFSAYPTVGTFSDSVYGGDKWEDYDIGLISLDNTGKIPLTSDVDGHPVTGVAQRIEAGDTLCHFGIRSGGPVCGPVVVSDTNKVRFEAPGKCGDSGGPVYLVRPDGTAEAVGIYVAVSNGDSSEVKCEDPHRFSIAQLIQPWLRAWDLTLVTTAAPG